MSVMLRVRLVDGLPDLLTALARGPADLAQADQLAADARDESVDLWFTMPEHSAVPRVGERVRVDPNFDSVDVLSVEHDALTGEVEVELADVDADQVGQPLALELLLTAGWHVVVPDP